MKDELVPRLRWEREALRAAADNMLGEALVKSFFHLLVRFRGWGSLQHVGKLSWIKRGTKQISSQGNGESHTFVVNFVANFVDGEQRLGGLDKAVLVVRDEVVMTPQP
jgi:hypothetical protein